MAHCTGIPFAPHSKPNSKVVRNAPAIARGEEQPALQGCLAEEAGVAARHKAREARHTSLWAHPVEDVRMFRNNAFE